MQNDDKIAVGEVMKMSPTFELVLNQVRSLTAVERSKLVEVLTKPQTSSGGFDLDRLKKIKSFRGKYRKILPSSEEFLAEKRAEVLLEDR